MRLILFAATLILTSIAANHPTPVASTLPELHKIKSISLSPSFSCRSEADFKQGYANTALFLSEAGRSANNPDLLFNGACGSPDVLEGRTAGVDLTVIADLGKVQLEELAGDQVFNVRRVNSPNSYSKFISQVRIEVGHTYAVLINKSRVRGFFYFTITGYVPNQKLDLKYVVKDFELMQVREESPGFDWSRKSD